MLICDEALTTVTFSMSVDNFYTVEEKSEILS